MWQARPHDLKRLWNVSDAASVRIFTPKTAAHMWSHVLERVHAHMDVWDRECREAENGIVMHDGIAATRWTVARRCAPWRNPRWLLRDVAVVRDRAALSTPHVGSHAHNMVWLPIMPCMMHDDWMPHDLAVSLARMHAGDVELIPLVPVHAMDTHGKEVLLKQAIALQEWQYMA